MNNKPYVLFILHLPPPVHGAAVMGRCIQESSIVNNSFNAQYINLSTSSNLDQIGKGGLAKLLTFIRLIFQIIRTLVRRKYHLCYMTLTAKGPGFYKDFLIVVLLKLFRQKIIYHFHNKGVASKQSGMLDHVLYKFVFENTRSILLSRHLYPDLQKYVSPKDVFYCPNGIPRIHYPAGSSLSKKKY